MPELMIEVIVVIVGLVIGSFLNVVIYRVPRKESIVSPRSHCPKCNHELNSIDLIPVIGYLLNRARCRYCKEPISIRYTLVEILTACLFWLVYKNSGLDIQLASGMVLTCVAVISTFTDIDEGIIPNSVTYPAFVVALALACVTPIGIVNALIGGFGFFVLMLIIALVSKGGMGGGDIKLAAVIGAFTGPQGAVVAIIIASLAGGLWGVFLMVRRNAGGKTAIRFGPFLGAGALIAWMWAQPIVDFYLSIMR